MTSSLRRLKPMRRFRHNVELDAALVLAGLQGGFEKVMFTGMALGFTSPDHVIARADWLKRQSEAYVDEVARRVVELEPGA